MERRRKARPVYSAASRNCSRARARRSSIERAGPTLHNANRSNRCKLAAPAPTRQSCGSSRRLHRSPARHPPAPRRCAGAWRPRASRRARSGPRRQGWRRRCAARHASWAPRSASPDRAVRPRRCAPARRRHRRGRVNSEIIPAQALGDGACGAAAKKRIEHEVAGVGGREYHTRQKSFRLLVAWVFLPARP